MRTGILIVVAAFLVICLMAILCREINKLVIKNERLMQHNQQLNDAVVNKAEQYAKLAELHNRLISEKNELVTRLGEAEAAWKRAEEDIEDFHAGFLYWRGKYHTDCYELMRMCKNRMDTINSYHKQIEELRMQKMAAEDKVRKLNDEVVLLSGMRYKVADLSAENDRLKRLLNKKKWF